LETSLNPTKRIVLLDVMRAWAVLMMIQGHSIDALLDSSYYDNSSMIFNIWLFNRGLTAPIFLFGSGFAYVIATFRKMDAGASLPMPVLVKRLRWIGVLFLIGALMHLPAGTVGDLFTLSADKWQRFFNVDVLRLISVTLLGLFGLFFLTRTRERLFTSALGIGLGLILVSPFVAMVTWTDFLPIGLAAWMTTATGSWFPIFPFSGYLFMGAAAAALYMKWQAEGRTRSLPKYYLIAASALLLAFFVPRLIWGWQLPLADGSASPWLTFSRLGWVLMLWAVIGFLLRKVERIPEIIPVVGQHTLFIYVSHIVMLYGSAWMPGMRQTLGKTLELEAVFIIIAFLIATTFTAAYWMHTQKINRSVVYRYLPYAAMVVLATVLLFA
jgi:uncharacterized membrane protein